MGIDPGTKLLGWCRYDSVTKKVLGNGVLKLDGRYAEDRMEDLIPSLRSLIPRDMDVDAVGIEKMYSANNRSDWCLHTVAWLLRRRLGKMGVAYQEIVRGTAYVCVLGKGKGRADKSEMLEYARAKFPEWDWTEDTADALAQAIAVAQMVKEED